MKFRQEKCKGPVMDLIHCWGLNSWGIALLHRTWGGGKQQSVHVPLLQCDSHEGEQDLGLYPTLVL